jgi:hypothetical protein
MRLGRDRLECSHDQVNLSDYVTDHWCKPFDHVVLQRLETPNECPEWRLQPSRSGCPDLLTEPTFSIGLPHVSLEQPARECGQGHDRQQ